MVQKRRDLKHQVLQILSYPSKEKSNPADVCHVWRMKTDRHQSSQVWGRHQRQKSWQILQKPVTVKAENVWWTWKTGSPGVAFDTQLSK